MLTPTFTGIVTDDLRLKVSDRPAFVKQLAALKGKPVEVIVREPASRRSLQLNAYWHAVPFALMAEHWGEDMEATKLLLLGECFGWRSVGSFHRLPEKLHTSELTKDEAHRFTEWMPYWAMTQFGVTIPLPGEVDWEAA